MVKKREKYEIYGGWGKDPNNIAFTNTIPEFKDKGMFQRWQSMTKFRNDCALVGGKPSRVKYKDEDTHDVIATCTLDDVDYVTAQEGNHKTENRAVKDNFFFVSLGVPYRGMGKETKMAVAGKWNGSPISLKTRKTIVDIEEYNRFAGVPPNESKDKNPEHHLEPLFHDHGLASVKIKFNGKDEKPTRCVITVEGEPRSDNSYPSRLFHSSRAKTFRKDLATIRYIHVTCDI